MPGVMSPAELHAYRRMTPAERRAKRRELLEAEDRPAAPAFPRAGAAGPRALLEAFEAGVVELFGLRREIVDFPRAYAALARLEGSR